MSSRVPQVDHEARKARVADAIETHAAAPGDALVDLPFEKFETRKVDRRVLKNAEYNPRTIGDKEKRRLRAGLKKLGLLAPVIWNELTGNLVGGHQRIASLDALMGTDKYTLTVAVVRLDAKQEREANILLNNPGAQGSYELGKLGELFKEMPLDLDATGFDEADLFQMFGDSPFLNREDNALDNLTDRLRAARQRVEAISRASQQKDDGQGYMVVVFHDTADRNSFLSLLGLDDPKLENGEVQVFPNRYQTGKTFRRLFEGVTFQIAEQASAVAVRRLAEMPLADVAEILAKRLDAAERGEAAEAVRAAVKG